MEKLNIDELQNQCLKSDIGHRTLYVLGRTLDGQKALMNEEQLKRQKYIEGAHRRRIHATLTGRPN